MQETIFVVDDDIAVRKSLSWLLESVNLNVEAFDSAESFLQAYSIYRVGCLLLDIRMPGMSGLQLQEELNKQKYPLPTVVITGHGDVPMAVRAMKNGALEFIEKPFNDQDLLDIIHIALEKDRINQKKRLEYDSIMARIANLTRREKEVLSLITGNLSNKQIAQKLGLSIKTVEAHRSRLMEKMHAESLVHLLEMLRKHQIVLIETDLI